MLRLLFPLLALVLAACGSRETLVRPAEAAARAAQESREKAGEAPPEAPIGADALQSVREAAPGAPDPSQTPEQDLIPAPIARPERQDDSLRRSEPRQDDPFDLPPA